MAAVHSSNNSDHRGTASPGVGGVNSWHFPKSGLGTPELFYSFSGGASSSVSPGAATHTATTTTSTSTSATTASGSGSGSSQPAWFKPQGVAASGSGTTAASSSATATQQPKSSSRISNNNVNGKSVKTEDDDRNISENTGNNNNGSGVSASARRDNQSQEQESKASDSIGGQSRSALLRTPDGNEEGQSIAGLIRAAYYWQEADILIHYLLCSPCLLALLRPFSLTCDYHTCHLVQLTEPLPLNFRDPALHPCPLQTSSSTLGLTLNA